MKHYLAKMLRRAANRLDPVEQMFMFSMPGGENTYVATTASGAWTRGDVTGP